MARNRVAEHTLRAEDLDWPAWIPVGVSFAVLIPAVVAAAQRHALFPPRWPAAILLLAVSPWIVEAGLVLAHVRRAHGRSKEDDPELLPKPVFVAVVVASVVALLRSPNDMDTTPFLLVFLAGEMGSRLSMRGALGVAGASAGAMIGVELAGWYDGSLLWVLGIVLAMFMGIALQSQLRLVHELHARQDELAERAAAHERQRIAREVHDVVAHSLAVTMLQLTGARMSLQGDAPDVAEAVAALRDAERLGRQSLNDIRRTIGLLAPGSPGTTAPMPTATDVADLVAEFETAGLDVGLIVRGDVSRLTDATGLALYRIVQESLANAAKHAPGARAEVVLEVVEGGIRLRVSNDESSGGSLATPSEGGLGVQGMKDRAALLGGTLRAGPNAVGWTVEADLPA